MVKRSLVELLAICTTYLLILTPSPILSQIGTRYRLCVPDVLFTFCQQMISDTSTQGGRIDCIPGNDKIDCIGRITRGEADFVILEPEEIYVAHRFFHDAFFVPTEIRTLPRQSVAFRYEPVAVVKNSARIRSLSDLRGKKSCHTAFARTSGWEVPISRLMQKNVMIKQCTYDLTTIERELAAAANFFGPSCAPGEWVPDPISDRELKIKYPQLCELCNNRRECSEADKYSGFRGSLRCLTENGGDVAWTKLETVYQFFLGGLQAQVNQQQQFLQPQNGLLNGLNGLNGNNNGTQGRNILGNEPIYTHSEYSFLCPDGSTIPINSDIPCTWAGRPWKAFLASNRLISPTFIADLQQQITLHRTIGAAIDASAPQIISWYRDILEFEPNEIEYHVPANIALANTPLIYLDRGNYTLTIEKPACPNRRVIRFCVRSDVERQKCMGLRMASIGRRIAPFFDCVLGEGKEDCLGKLVTGQADVMTVNARDAFHASRKHHLTPILSEAERFGDEETDASRYTVAVIRADSGIQSISDLRGKRSCHGSVNSLSGWNIPLIVLRDSGLISPYGCNFGQSIAQFFSASCLPGAKDTSLNLPETLCSLCVGASFEIGGQPPAETVCADNPLEGFYGDLGAFRCLPTLQGDVAFVDHLTPLLNTDGLANATWASGLSSAGFRLVCPIGPTRPITEFRQCHWGKVPSDKVITNEDHDYHVREDIRLTLLRTSQTFHTEQTVLRLFGPYYGVPDLLFKDISTGLVPLNDAVSPENSRKIDQYGRYVSSNKDVVFDQQYSNRIIRDIEDCGNNYDYYSSYYSGGENLISTTSSRIGQILMCFSILFTNYWSRVL